MSQATIDAAVADAAQRTGVDESAVTVVLAESVVWPNSALGCPKPGNLYTDALVPGARVVVEAGGEQLDYRSGSNGQVKLCENPPGPG